MQLSSRSKLRKEACALWQVLFNFARCPASRQLGIAEQRKSLPTNRQCLKQSFQHLQLTAHTTDRTTICAQNPASYKLLLNFMSTVSIDWCYQWLVTKEVERRVLGHIEQILLCAMRIRRKRSDLFEALLLRWFIFGNNAEFRRAAVERS